MQQDFLVECRSYDQSFRGSWRAYQIPNDRQIGDEDLAAAGNNCVRLWLPAQTSMHWSTGIRPLRRSCFQIFWPQRWYTLSAFYEGRTLVHTYATITLPAVIDIDRLSYVDLELSILVKPDLSYEVLTQAEFDHAAEILRYSEETRIGALMALRTLTSVIQRSAGVYAAIPYQLKQADPQFYS